MDFFELLKAIIFGIIQGITEWLPISSTGHLILVDELMQLQASDAFKTMFFVVIQLGSILAVGVLYFHKLNPFSSLKSYSKRVETVQLWCKVAVAAIPAAIIAVLFLDAIDAALLNPLVVAISLIVYGILFILLERWNKKRYPAIIELEDLTYWQALMIGLFQILALIPGTSRSGSTILGGMIIGVSRKAAAEFSFFLAIPMMCGASLIKLLKFGLSYTGMEIVLLAIGFVTAFIVSVFVIRALMQYIKKHDFTIFGYYRIILGVIVIAYFMSQSTLLS